MTLLRVLSGFIASLCCLALSAHADDMRCKNRLVTTGTSQYEVKAICGEPDAEQHHTERRMVQRQISAYCNGDRYPALCTKTVANEVEVTVEEWTYDFGSLRLMQYITFEDGKLIKVSAGGYGHKP
jgi:hypothetical protein